MPSREKRQKTCPRGSTAHFLRCGLKARPPELRRFSAILAVMQPDFSATQTVWRSRQSGANLSLPEFPGNREFNREFWKFWTSKTVLLISKPHISVEKNALTHSPGREFSAMYQGIRFTDQRCVQGSFLLRVTPEPHLLIRNVRAHACSPERIPTAHAARPSSRECPGTTSQNSSREAADPRG